MSIIVSKDPADLIWPDDFINKVICGDCLEVMKKIPDGAVDLVLTDPPYGINLDSSWLTTLHVQRGKPANASDDKIIGDDGSLDLSPLWLRFGRWLIWGFPYITPPDSTGWLVWDKQPGVEHRGITAPVEVAATNIWRGYDVVRNMWGGYMRAQGEARVAHPTQKPVKVCRYPISKTKDDLILDPFLGSGTTAVAAKQLGRKFIGIEINMDYCKIAEERLRQEELF